ncbi:MAG: hypothetical protein V4489_08155 [Chlamydiota bacterium]
MGRLKSVIRRGILWSVPFLCFIRCNADASAFIQEGVWTTSEEPTLQKIVEKIIVPFLPYNPRILEIRKDSGSMTEILMGLYPKGNFIVFTSDLNDAIESHSVFFFSYTPDMNWDDLCRYNSIEQVDLIRWDIKELGPSFIKLSSKITETASMLSIKTYGNAKKEKNPKFINLLRRLECNGFRLVSHCYKEGGEGEAIFVKKEIYDALF